MEDVRLMKAHIGPEVKIKAAGGIRTREEMEAYLAAGCSRIGTSGANFHAAGLPAVKGSGGRADRKIVLNIYWKCWKIFIVIFPCHCAHSKV